MKNRKRNRMKGFDYASNNLYFVTNCVKNNVCCLGRVVPVGTDRVRTGCDLSIQDSSVQYEMELNEYGLVVQERINWLASQYPYVDIHNFKVMPNHFHLILEIDGLRVKDLDIKIKSLSSLMGAMKTTSSHQIHNLGLDHFEWHRSFHDNIIRNEESYLRISEYIDQNPQSWFEDRFYVKN